MRNMIGSYLFNLQATVNSQKELAGSPVPPVDAASPESGSEPSLVIDWSVAMPLPRTRSNPSCWVGARVI